MKQKLRSLSTRLTVLILIMTLGTGFAMAAVGYTLYRITMMREYEKLGRNVTATAEKLIDINSLERYAAAKKTDGEYEMAMARLCALRQEMGVTYLYVFKVLEQGFLYLFDTDPTEDRLKLGDIDPWNEGFPQEEKVPFLAGDPIPPDVYTSPYGTSLTIHLSLRQDDGSLAGYYIAADFNISRIVAERKRYLLILSMVSAAVALICGAAYWYIIRRSVVKPVDLMTAATRGFLEQGYRETTEILAINTGDELQELAESIDVMEKKIITTISDLREAEEEASLASKTKTTFLTHMSHELRTPLNAVLGMTDIALEAADDREKTVNALMQIRASADHLSSILNDILEISNIDNGRIALSPDFYALTDIFQSVDTLIHPLCAEKHLSYVSNTAAIPSLAVKCDRPRLVQVLTSLLGNAVKYTDTGEVRFTASMRSKTQDALRIYFEVKDTGIGISAERQNELFENFSPGDKNIFTKYGGVGVRLAMSQKLVQMMGGCIKAESVQGSGAVFSFELDFEYQALQAVSVNDGETGKTVSFAGKRILIADDVPINRIVAGNRLKRLGATIVEASDGREALNIISPAPDKIDLVLMDVSMPNMDGYEATRAIRALDHPRAKRLPIIALTAHTYQEDVDNALAAGMNAHLGKPVNFALLVSTVSQFLAE